eukprot:gene21007-27866_t
MGLYAQATFSSTNTLSSTEGAPPASTFLRPTFALTVEGASKVMAAAEAEALANNWDVSDASGVPIQLHRNAFPASAEIAMGKAKTSAMFGKETAAESQITQTSPTLAGPIPQQVPSRLEKAANVEEGGARTALLSAPFILMRGGVPIIIEGQCIGAVGVSGVRADQDEQVARAGVAALLA